MQATGATPDMIEAMLAIAAQTARSEPTLLETRQRRRQRSDPLRRDVAIAMSKPITDGHDSEAALRRMAHEGLVTLPTRKGPLPRADPVPISGKPLLQTIIDDRDDRA